MNHRTKFTRGFCWYRGKGKLSREYIESLIPDVALNKLTSHDLMLIMQAFEKAYYDGKNSPKD